MEIKELINRLVLSVAFSIGILAVVFFSTIITNEVYPIMEVYMDDFKYDGFFETIISIGENESDIIYQEDNVTMTYTLSNLASACNMFEDGSQKVKCVNQFVKKYHNFSRDNPSNDLREIFENGSNCVGYSNAYKKILKEMDLHYKPLTICFPNNKSEQHGYCLVDQKKVFCVDIKTDDSNLTSCHRLGVGIY